MQIDIASTSLFNQPQSITIGNEKIAALVGGNGAGKSTILENVFSTRLNNLQDRLVCFSSGQNERYSEIFKKYLRQSRRLIIDNHGNYTNPVNSFYFNAQWSGLLIFFASALKANGLVRNYLRENNYVVEQDGQDTSSTLYIQIRVLTNYIQQINREVQREAQDPEFHSIRKTTAHTLLEKLINGTIRGNYDFDAPIYKTGAYISASRIISILDTGDVNRIFTMLSYATYGSKFIDLNTTSLRLRNNRELGQLSDGEFQLLIVYSLVDLFDSETSLMLLDEIDAHLHYVNVSKMWTALHNISGNVLATTHLVESIIQNGLTRVKLINRGEINTETIPSELTKRLNSLTSSHKHFEYVLASHVENIVLIDDEFDWVLFKSLCTKKIPEFNSSILDKIHVVKCPSTYSSEDFAKAKLNWIENLKKHVSTLNTATLKRIFVICDRDTLPLSQVGSNLQVHGDNRQQQFARDKYSYVLSWKRREIENYLMGYTLCENNGLLDAIDDLLPRASPLLANESNDTDAVRILDVKPLLQPLYLKDQIQNNERGVDFDKLQGLVDIIPAEEISEDIRLMYDFIIQKCSANNVQPPAQN